MYNLVACYDTLELKSRGDVLSDKVSSQSCQTYKRCSKWRSTSTCHALYTIYILYPPFRASSNISYMSAAC